MSVAKQIVPTHDRRRGEIFLETWLRLGYRLFWTEFCRKI